MATGWHAAISAGVQPGMTVAVVGDGAVGLCAVLAASRLGAKRVIAMSRHQPRQQLAREFGATDIVTERGDEGIARINELTDGVGADAVMECVGTGDSVLQALRSARPGGMVGWVGAPHGVKLRMRDLFWRNVGVRGGPAPVRQYLPDLLDRVWNREIDPGKVFDLELPSSRSPKVTAPWTSAAPSRCCCVRECLEYPPAREKSVQPKTSTWRPPGKTDTPRKPAQAGQLCLMRTREPVSHAGDPPVSRHLSGGCLDGVLDKHEAGAFPRTRVDEPQ
jgi:hypothetical protein